MQVKLHVNIIGVRKLTFAASSGKKPSAMVVKSTDQVFRAGVQYDLPHGVQEEHLRSILGIPPPSKSLGAGTAL